MNNKIIISVLICFCIINYTNIGSQPLDAERFIRYSGDSLTGTPGDVTGDGIVNIIDALMIAQYYVDIQQDLPPFLRASQWEEVHIAFGEITQESLEGIVYVDKDIAIGNVIAFELDIHSKNDDEQGIIWIDDVTLYKETSISYRNYYIIGNYDELPISSTIPIGGRYYAYNNSVDTIPPSYISGSIIEGGPSGIGNCLEVTYRLGGPDGDPDTTSLGIGLDIFFDGEPSEVPMGTYNVADLRVFTGISFWIKIQKSNSTKTAPGNGTETDQPDYLLRARLRTVPEVIGDNEMYNYFGLNLDF